MWKCILLAMLYSSTIARADDIKCVEAVPNAQFSVSFKPESTIQDLVTWVAGFSCKNVVIAPGVAKHATKVSILAPRKVTPKQALQLFVDAVESTGLVVTQKPDTLVISLGPNSPKNCTDIAQAPHAPQTTPPVPISPPDPNIDETVEKALATIKKIDATHYEITRALLDSVTSNPLPYMKGVRVVPSIKDGKPDGMKLYAIHPKSPYARLGFLNGDTVQAINGMKLDTAENALEAYMKLRTAKRFDIALIRAGKPVTLVITIK